MNITINAVGDISLGDYNMTLGFGVNSKIERYGSEFIFCNVSKILKTANIVFGNLETPLSSIKGNKRNFSSLIMRGSPSAISGLKKSGFSILNVANNHMMQHGSDVFLNTCKLLLENNIYPLGVSGCGDFSSAPVIIKQYNKRIGFLGYSFVKDIFSKNILYAKGDRNRIQNDIKKLKIEADTIILSIHWGLELMAKPSNIIRSLSHFLIDSGADIILGHHPHVVQNIEYYKNKLIFYSLGNFVFDIPFAPCRESIIAQIELNDYNIAYNLVPIRINDKYQPTIMTKKLDNSKNKDNDNLSNILTNSSSSMYDEEFNFNYYQEFKRLRQKERLSILVQFIKHLLTSPSIYSIKIIVHKIFTRRK